MRLLLVLLLQIMVFISGCTEVTKGDDLLPEVITENQSQVPPSNENNKRPPKSEEAEQQQSNQQADKGDNKYSVEQAYEQEQLYEDYGYGRLVLINAFREHYEGNQKELDASAVSDYSAKLYGIDGLLSYRRAISIAFLFLQKITLYF